MQRLTRTLVNVAANWGGYAVNLVVLLFLTPFVFSHLGKEAMGVWVLMLQVAGYFGLLDLGIQSTLSYFVARHWTKDDRVQLEELAGVAVSIYLALGAIILGITLVLVSILPAVFHAIPEGLIEEARAVLMIVGAGMAVTMPLFVFHSILRGLQRFDLINVLAVAVAASQAIGTVVLLRAGHGIVALAWLQMAVKAVSLLIAVLLVRRIAPTLRIRARRGTPSVFRQIANYAAPSFVTAVAGRIAFFTDLIVLGIFLPAEVVAFFFFGGKLVQALRDVGASAMGVLAPLATEMQAKEEHEGLQGLLIASTRCSFLISLPIGVAFLVLGQAFLLLWVGDSSPGAAVGVRTISYPVLCILAIPQFLALSQYGTSSLLFGTARHHSMSLLALLEASMNLILSILLVRKYGAMGVALGTAIPLFFTFLVFWPWAIRRHLGVRFFPYLRRSFLPALLPGLVYAGTLMVMMKLLPPTSWFRFAVNLGVGLAVFAPAGWLFLLQAEERRQIGGLLQALSGRKEG